jgi:hypothetical protein
MLIMWKTLYIGIAVVLLAGCQPVRMPEKPVQKSNLWPIFQGEQKWTRDDSGGVTQHDTGKFLLLGRWDHERCYDADGKLARSEEHSRFWPLVNDHTRYTDGHRTSRGTVLLLFHYEVGSKKVDVGGPGMFLVGYAVKKAVAGEVLNVFDK